MRFLLIVIAALIVLAGLVLWPRIDLIVSGWFYVPDGGFFLRDFILFRLFHNLAYGGARVLGIFLLFMCVLTAVLRTSVTGMGVKAWLFLFLGLLIGPGLVANGVFKDHWGRARPSEVMEFGGASQFTPALIPADQCDRNCSFVSGDGAFGFYLTAFAYVVPQRQSRRFFWGGAGLGFLFALARLAGGGHFFSDSVYAAFFMLAILAALHAALFGWKTTQERWRLWF